MTAIVASFPVLRSFLVTDTTQQPHPPSWHITFVPTSYIKKHYQWQIQGWGPPPPPPPPIICRQINQIDKSRSHSMKSPFLGFLVIQAGYWSVLFSSDEALQSAYYFIRVNFHGKVDMKQGESKTFLRYILLWKIWLISIEKCIKNWCGSSSWIMHVNMAQGGQFSKITNDPSLACYQW